MSKCEQCPVSHGHCRGETDHREFCDWDKSNEVLNRHIVVVSTKSVPPLHEQIANAAGAVIRVAAAVATGSPVSVGEEEFSRRLAICRSNECGEWLEDQGRCAVCGCWSSLKAKLSTEKCPKGLW